MRFCAALLAVALLAPLGSTGCLQNLNQQKYFDKLEESAPEQAKRVRRHRRAIEAELTAALAEAAPAAITELGLWGASWDAPRRVSDGEQLFMRGRMFHEGRRASSYYLVFTVAAEGSVEIHDLRVYE